MSSGFLQLLFWKCPAIFTSNIFKPGRHLGSSFTQARTNFWTDKNLRNRHVSGFTLVPRLLWEYWQQSMRRGGHLEYSIHGKEPSSILLRHRINKYPGLASTLKSAFKTLRVRMLDSSDTCGRRRIRKEKVADWKISGYVWRGFTGCRYTTHAYTAFKSTRKPFVLKSSFDPKNYNSYTNIGGKISSGERILFIL